MYFAPYAYRNNNKIFCIDLSKSYHYPDWDWYRIPEKLNRPYWSEPYFDEGAGNVIMTTYSVPFYKAFGNRRIFAGVTTVDISLQWLKEYIKTIDIYRSGYVFLITQKGKILSYPDKQYIMHDTVFSLAKKFNSQELNKVGRQMVEGKTGFTFYKSIINGKKGWIYYTPMKFTGWSLAVFFPEDELLSDMKELNLNILFLSILGLILLCITVILVTHRITKPLRKVTEAAENIGKGEFNHEMPVLYSNDEVGKLSKTFESMRVAIIEYMENLKTATAAKEKLESELDVARRIQMSIIPHSFPAFPKNKEFNLYATIKSAKAVGGDLYDFFMLDSCHLCFVIGDVSGKGVPASLFMAVTRTLLRAKADISLKTGEILTEINKDLCVGNESAMFVTFYICILNVNNGNLEYSNAGHTSPVILRSNGDIQQIIGTNEPALGIFEDEVYSTKNLILKAQDRFLLYTDGVTEAVNTKNEQFLEERLLANVLDLTVPTEETVRKLLKAVEDFSAGCEQLDDITIELLEYIGPSDTAS